MQKEKQIKIKYIEGIGRRKTSVARVRISETNKPSFIVNDKDIKEYFKTDEQKSLVQDLLYIKPSDVKDEKVKWGVQVKVNGGGLHSQAEAVRHGLARALVISNQSLREKLKPLGYLKRDPRAKERRKFGLKKARKGPKWSKR